jgi:5-methylcytosine-specific restriction endonuclease McrA
MSKIKIKRKAVPPELQLRVWRRDGWLCVWCKRPVIFAPVMKYLQQEVRAANPTASVTYYHAHWTREAAPLLDELGAVIDHEKAATSREIVTERELVTSCNKCNIRKSDRPAEVWDERFKYRPVKSKYGSPKNWDGLTSLFVVLADRHNELISSADRTWIRLLKIGQAIAPSLLETSANGEPRGI